MIECCSGVAARGTRTTHTLGVTRSEPLAVLVVGTDDWAVAQAREALRVAGHVALGCHEPGEPDFPCNALRAGRKCPLDDGARAVLVVRARPLPEPAPGESGAICALHAGLPLVTSGMVSNSPFAPFADAEVAPSGDVVGACESAVAGRLEVIADITEKALG